MGYFSYQKTGKFAYGSTSVSQNAFGLSFSFNREFKNYYPNKSTDLIPQHYQNSNLIQSGTGTIITTKETKNT